MQIKQSLSSKKKNTYRPCGPDPATSGPAPGFTSLSPAAVGGSWTTKQAVQLFSQKKLQKNIPKRDFK